MTHAATTTTTTRPVRSWQRVALGLLVALMGIVPFALAASAMMPGTLSPVLNHLSPALAIVMGVSTAVGLALVPVLGRMGRIGAIVLATSVAIFVIGNAVRPGGYFAGNPTDTPLDPLLALLVVAGYFTLLFGALQRAGWAWIGAHVVGGTALVLVVLLLVVPAGPLSIEQLAERVVYGALLAAGAAVGTIAAVRQFRQRRRALS